MKRVSIWSAPATLAALVLAGCPGPSAQMQEATQADVDAANAVAAEEEAHGHHHEAPHGGELIELGDHQYNLEVVFPDADGNLSLYVLGPHAEAAVAVAAEDIEFELEAGDDEIEVELTAVEPVDGKASHFTAPASALGEAKDADHLHAHAHVTIEGTEFTGGLAHHDHDDHHEDEDEDHKDDAGEKEGESAEPAAE